MNKQFKIGDKVILKGCPYDEQIPEELDKFVKIASKTQIVTDIKEVSTTSQWIKTDLEAEWSDSAWYMLEERG